MKNAGRTSGFTPLVAGVASLVFGLGIALILENDAEATTQRVSDINAQIQSAQTALVQQQKINHGIGVAARRLQPYCLTQAQSNDLIFAAINLSPNLQPSLDKAIEQSVAGGSTPSPQISPSPAASSSPQPTQTTPPAQFAAQHGIISENLSARYHGTFSSLQNALNVMAMHPGPIITVTLAKLSRTQDTPNGAPTPAPTAMPGSPQATPAPNNSLYIDLSFHRSSIDVPTCNEIQNDARYH